MPKQILFEGQTHTFPDDFTDADIQQALSSYKPPPPRLEPPGAPKPPLPAGLATPQYDPRASAISNYMRGVSLGPPSPITKVLEMPRQGYQQAKAGVERMATGFRPTTDEAEREKQRRDILRRRGRGADTQGNEAKHGEWHVLNHGIPPNLKGFRASPEVPDDEARVRGEPRIG